MDLLFSKDDIKKNIADRNQKANDKWKRSMERALNADFTNIPKSKRFDSKNRDWAK